MLPGAGGWLQWAITHGAGDTTICPKHRYDGEVPLESQYGSSIDGYYVYQKGPGGDGGAYLTDVAPGTTWVQHQSEMHRIVTWEGNKSYDGWFEEPDTWVEAEYGKSIDAPNWEVGFEDDASVVIEVGTEIKAVSLYTPESAQNPGSRHVLAHDSNGNGINDWKSEIVMELAGKDNKLESNFPVTTYIGEAGVTSYGMNNLVQDTRSRSAQILLLDYRKLVADYDGQDDDDVFEEQFVPRHFGKANVLHVDGRVESMGGLEIHPILNPAPWQH